MAHSELAPYLLATVELAVPALVGLAAGRLARRLPRVAAALVAALAAVALPFGAIPIASRVGAWDVVLVGAVAALAVPLGRGRAGAREAALAFASTSFALAALELGVGITLPAPPEFPPPSAASLVFDAASWDGACETLFDAARARRARGALVPPFDPRPTVAHFGDSMTFGAGVDEAEAFPALLGAREPGVAHLNFGVPNVGTDYEYLLAGAVLARRPVGSVVVHFFVGNDAYDVDAPYECCDDGPLLDYAGDGARARCPSPRWRIGRRTRLATSPAPYPLRVATSFSATASWLVHLWPAFAHAVVPPPHFVSSEADASDEGFRHLEAILARWRDDAAALGVPFTLVLLPHRDGLERPDFASRPPHRTRTRVTAIASRLGIRVLDAWEPFAAAVARDGAARWFLVKNGRPDIHFTSEGHRLLADWLVARLPPPVLGAEPAR